MRGGGGLSASGTPPGTTPLWDPPLTGPRSPPGGSRGGHACAGPPPPPPRDPALCPQDIQHTEEFLIKPESRVAQLDTSQWPLLLKVGADGGSGAFPSAPFPCPALRARLRRRSLPRAVLAAGPSHVRAEIALQSSAGGGIWLPALTSSPPACKKKTKNFINLTSASWACAPVCPQAMCVEVVGHAAVIPQCKS